MRQVKIESMGFSMDWTPSRFGTNARETAMAALLEHKKSLVGDQGEITVEVKNRDGTVQKFKAEVTFELEAV